MWKTMHLVKQNEKKLPKKPFKHQDRKPQTTGRFSRWWKHIETKHKPGGLKITYCIETVKSTGNPEVNMYCENRLKRYSLEFQIKDVKQPPLLSSETCQKMNNYIHPNENMRFVSKMQQAEMIKDYGHPCRIQVYSMD